MGSGMERAVATISQTAEDAAIGRGVPCLHQLGLGQSRACLQLRLQSLQEALHLATRGATHRRVALEQPRRHIFS